MFGIKYLFGENIKDMCNLCKYIKVSIRKDIKREKKDAEQDAKIDNIEKKMETIQDTQIQIIDILTKPKEGK
jgi:phage terminase large subunit-like protein